MIPRAPGLIGPLALALFHRWEPRKLAVILTTYIDESGTHGGSPHLILAGWVGRFGRWCAFEPKWHRHLKHHGLTYFHSRLMNSNSGEFRGWSDRDKYDFIIKAGKITTKHALFGFSICLKETDYTSFYRCEPKLRARMDSRYQVCFRYCLSTIPIIAREAECDNDVELFFVLEDSQHFGGARAVFNEVKENGNAEIADVLRECVPGAKRDHAALQAADAGAYNTFQYEQDASLLSSVPSTGSFRGDRARDKCPIYRLQVEEESLREMRGWAERIDARKTRKIMFAAS